MWCFREKKSVSFKVVGRKRGTVAEFSRDAVREGVFRMVVISGGMEMQNEKKMMMESR